MVFCVFAGGEAFGKCEWADRRADGQQGQALYHWRAVDLQMGAAVRRRPYHIGADQDGVRGVFRWANPPGKRQGLLVREDTHQGTRTRAIDF